MRHLQAKFQSLRRLPVRKLASLPTPIERCDPIAKRAGCDQVWIKRDDLTGTPYGGNKIRKLEFLLGDALERGSNTVFTCGAIGSNHCLATSVYAAEAGLKTRIRHFPQPPSAHVVHNCLAVASTGARMSCGPRWTLPFSLAWQRLTATPRGIYYIPGGGSSPLGTLGYVNAALEIEAQIQSGELPPPQVVVVPVGTGGTLVGLKVGFELAGRTLQLVGVRVIDKIVANQAAMNSLMRRVVRLLARYDVSVDSETVSFGLEHSQFGAGYGVKTDAATAAVDLARDEAGINLDDTYTGKAMAAILAKGFRGKRVLFVNTLNSRPVSDLISTTELPKGYGKYLPGEAISECAE